jgi:hypothetical protein
MRAGGKSAAFALHAVPPPLSDDYTDDRLVALSTQRQHGHFPDQPALACVLVLWVVVAICGSHCVRPPCVGPQDAALWPQANRIVNPASSGRESATRVEDCISALRCFILYAA